MNTSNGNMCGSEWDEYCHRLLSLKYSNYYQRVPSKFGGDLGIEGFVQHSGIVFQCYCPDGEPTSPELYMSQRDKITTDINKLLNNETELIKILGDLLIREWHFITPRYENKELLAHCRRKEEEVKAANAPHIHPDFMILIKTEDDYIPEKGILNNYGLVIIDPPIKAPLPFQIKAWTNQNNSLYQNLNDKIQKLTNDPDDKIKIIETNIRCYLIGQNTLENIRTQFPEQYEKIYELKDSWENRISLMSMVPTNNSPGDILFNALNLYKAELETGFPKIISRKTLEVLSNEAISDWLIRCPLDF
jgi:hypothetical protein